jgi:hypothetical protein
VLHEGGRDKRSKRLEVVHDKNADWRLSHPGSPNLVKPS